MTRRFIPRSARLLGVVAFLIFGLSVPSWGLDLTDGHIRLTLHERTGRFSLAWETGGASARFVPLLAADDPRTSMLSIVAGNRVYTMGDSPEFSEKIEKTASGAQFVWRSSLLQVTEAFTFIPAAGSTAASGVRIDLTLKNLSTQDLAVGARYLFDTYLGEASRVHFRTDTFSQLTHELALTPVDKIPWWVSPLPADPDALGFQVMVAGDGVTAPDRVIFANWKRLTDSSWGYEASTVRTFSLLPYSVNDSAAAQYYDPQLLSSGGERTITLALGKYSKAGLVAAAPAKAPSAAQETATQQAAAGEQVPVSTAGGQGAGQQQSAAARDAEKARQQALAAQREEEKARQEALAAQKQALRADLSSVDAMLAELDQALAAGTPLSAERLAEIQAALEELGSRGGGSSPGNGE